MADRAAQSGFFYRAAKAWNSLSNKTRSCRCNCRLFFRRQPKHHVFSISNDKLLNSNSETCPDRVRNLTTVLKLQRNTLFLCPPNACYYSGDHAFFTYHMHSNCEKAILRHNLSTNRPFLAIPRYITVDHAIVILQDLGPECFISKLNIKSACPCPSLGLGTPWYEMRRAFFLLYCPTIWSQVGPLSFS